jgi:hypothetical protein
MNIGAFLHTKRQNSQHQLPLPLAPTYILPQHQWYFSSPSLVPLRKKKENSSPLSYLNMPTVTSKNDDSIN